jgi:hypothetical protein
MDVNNILISSGITTAIYILLKGGMHIYKNYYIKSECQGQTLEITLSPSPPDTVIQPSMEDKVNVV